MARRRDCSHIQRWRRRMTWFYKQKEQAQDKPEPVHAYFDSLIGKHFENVKQSEVISYFDKELVADLQSNTLATRDTDGNK